MSKNDLIRQWNLNGAFDVQNGKVIFHNGQPNQKSVAFHYSPLHYDDYVEMSLKVRFDKKISQSMNEQEEDKTNVFIIQFLPQYPKEAFRDLNDSSSVTLEGFTIMLVTHDSHNDNSQNQ